MRLWQSWQNRAFNRSLSAPRNGSAVHVGTGDVVGRLSIPRLHVAAMIREGTSAPVLSVALGHIPGTAFPGQPGNIGVAGHRDSLFRGLRNVAKNDEIIFETSHATYTYRVESTQIVKPEDVGVLNPGSIRELTLVTCYPFNYVGAAPERFIVKAQLLTDKKPVTVVPVATPRPAPRRNEVAFDVSEGHSRELVPGRIWFGVDSTDVANGTVTGWLWVMPDRRTIWLRDTPANEPVFFDQDGKTRELRISGITATSAKGSVIVPPDRVSPIFSTVSEPRP
jgi:LPXTG-site transpeptidase (sortase) family protein